MVTGLWLYVPISWMFHLCPSILFLHFLWFPQQCILITAFSSECFYPLLFGKGGRSPRTQGSAFWFTCHEWWGSCRWDQVRFKTNCFSVWDSWLEHQTQPLAACPSNFITPLGFPYISFVIHRRVLNKYVANDKLWTIEFNTDVIICPNFNDYERCVVTTVLMQWNAVVVSEYFLFLFFFNVHLPDVFLLVYTSFVNSERCSFVNSEHL